MFRDAARLRLSSGNMPNGYTRRAEVRALCCVRSTVDERVIVQAPDTPPTLAFANSQQDSSVERCLASYGVAGSPIRTRGWCFEDAVWTLLGDIRRPLWTFAYSLPRWFFEDRPGVSGGLWRALRFAA